MSKESTQRTSPSKHSSASHKHDDSEQSKLFIEKAREIGANEEYSRSDELIGRLAKKPPEPKRRNKIR